MTSPGFRSGSVRDRSSALFRAGNDDGAARAVEHDFFLLGAGIERVGLDEPAHRANGFVEAEVDDLAQNLAPAEALAHRIGAVTQRLENIGNGPADFTQNDGRNMPPPDQAHRPPGDRLSEVPVSDFAPGFLVDMQNVRLGHIANA
jgi:hypothetical protein